MWLHLYGRCVCCMLSYAKTFLYNLLVYIIKVPIHKAPYLLLHLGDTVITIQTLLSLYIKEGHTFIQFNFIKNIGDDWPSR